MVFKILCLNEKYCFLIKNVIDFIGYSAKLLCFVNLHNCIVCNSVIALLGYNNTVAERMAFRSWALSLGWHRFVQFSHFFKFRNTLLKDLLKSNFIQGANFAYLNVSQTFPLLSVFMYYKVEIFISSLFERSRDVGTPKIICNLPSRNVCL